MSEQNDKTLLSFKLNDEFFALDAMKVNHILEIPEITHVPDTPDYMKGIINLHGNIIPVVDLRLIMGVEVKELTSDSAIIVIGPDEHKDSSLGLIVDMVNEVIETNGMEMKTTVVSNEQSLLQNFKGTLSIHDQFVHVVDIDELAGVAAI